MECKMLGNCQLHIRVLYPCMGYITLMKPALHGYIWKRKEESRWDMLANHMLYIVVGSWFKDLEYSNNYYISFFFLPFSDCVTIRMRDMVELV